MRLPQFKKSAETPLVPPVIDEEDSAIIKEILSENTGNSTDKISAPLKTKKSKRTSTNPFLTRIMI